MEKLDSVNLRVSPAEVGESRSRLLWSWLMHPAFVPVCIAMGLLVRLMVLLFLPVEQFSDSAWYVARAISIAAGEGYTEGGLPTAYWPIGWPAVLAAGYKLSGSMPLTIAVISLLSAAAIMGLILWFARNVVGSEQVGRIALLAYALYPNHIAYAGQAATETFYTAIIMAAFALLIGKRKHWRWLMVSGLLFGLATLIKPQSLGFPFGAIIAIWFVYKGFQIHQALLSGALVYLCLFLVVLPWSYRNFMVYDEFVLVSTNGGAALIHGANDYATGGFFEYEETPVFKQFGIREDQRFAHQLELGKLEKRAAKDWIAENPGKYVALMPRKAMLLWLKDTDGFWSVESSHPEKITMIRVAQVANMALYGLVLLLALPTLLRGCVALFRRESQSARLLLLFCMPAFVTLTAMAFTGQIRYHFPAMPFLFIAAAFTVWSIATKKGKSRLNG